MKVRANPKLYKRCLVVTLTILCSLLAIYMTAKQVMTFLENDDSTSIHYRRFNLSPNDRYPTFSICFTGTELYWNKAKSIFNLYGLNPSSFEAMLKGQKVFAYDYNYSSMLYNKRPVDISNSLNIGTKQLSLDTLDILTGLEFGTEDEISSIRYGSGMQGQDVENVPLYVGYNTPDTICFTRMSKDSLNTQRVLDWMAFNNSIFGNDQFENYDLQIFVHYPQQLLRSFHKPVFKKTIDFWNTRRSNNLKITISKVTILRKRSGSNVPCDDHLENDDEKFKQEIINRIKCTPPYWMQHASINSSDRICNSGAELEKAYKLIRKYKNILKSYYSPCTKMEILSKYDQVRSQINEDPQISFLYEEADYEELKNAKSFDFTSFVSGVGGFIGIFLGYSLLQIPDLLALLPSLILNLRRSIKGLEFGTIETAKLTLEKWLPGR